MGDGIENQKPVEPTSPLLKKAFRVLDSAFTSSCHFLKVHDNQKSTHKGNSTDEEQDQLRAMLIFASAGLDSMLKHLIKDALPAILGKNNQSQKKFEEFIERQIKAKGETNPSGMAKFLSQSLSKASPREHLISELRSHLTGDSLQSKDKLASVVAHLGLEEVRFNESIKESKKYFDIRNQIIHELDASFSNNRMRQQRPRNEMVDEVSKIFSIAKKIMQEVDSVLLPNKQDKKTKKSS